MAQQKYASFAAKDTREAGSLPSDFDATITSAQFTKEAPDGYNAEGNPIFGVIKFLQDGDGAEEERTVVQSYSLGAKAGDEFTISDDGFGLIPSDDSVTSTRKGSKFDLWKCSLENEGVPQTITETGDLSKFVGVKGHWRRVDDAKLLGKAREFGDDKKSKSKFPPQTLVCVKLINLPGEKPKSGGASTSTAAATTSAGTSAPASSGGGSIDDRTTAFLMDVLAGAKDNKVQRSQLIALLSKAAIKEKDRQDIARRGSDEEFLNTLKANGVISYDAAAKPQIVGFPA